MMLLLLLASIILVSSTVCGKQCCTAPGFLNFGEEKMNVAEAFERYGIVRDYLPVPPTDLLVNIYGSAQKNLGNKISPLRTTFENVLRYPKADPNALYTWMFLDIDYPSQKKSTAFIHQLRVNIVGGENILETGADLVPLCAVAPYPGSGPHRFIVLAYKQNSTIDSDDLDLLKSTRYRSGFSVVKFAERYGLGDPDGGNFLLSETDNCVSA